MTFTPSRAVVTGASAGIGTAFAHALAARGADLVLVARREDRLRELAAAIEAAHRVRVEVVPADLGEPDSGIALRGRIDGPVDLLINNAGFGAYGPLAEADPRQLATLVDVDIRALVDLTRAFLPEMIAAGRGGIVNIGSTASFQPVPNMAAYGAAKAFVRSFTQAVWYEARQHGVKVTALNPGATRTEFFEVVGTDSAAVGRYQTPEQVVATGLRALDRRSTPPSVVSGGGNAFAAWATRLVPQRILISGTARLMR
jgi:short-subunit dehydrogenase